MFAAQDFKVGKRRIVCTVIRVPEETNATAERLAARPSDLVPWADPYIAGLVHNLQNEVRRERTSQGPVLRPLSPNAASRRTSPMHRLEQCELDPPTPAFDYNPGDRRPGDYQPHDLEPSSSDWDGRNAPQWPTDDRLTDRLN